MAIIGTKYANTKHFYEVYKHEIGIAVKKIEEAYAGKKDIYDSLLATVESFKEVLENSSYDFELLKSKRGRVGCYNIVLPDPVTQAYVRMTLADFHKFSYYFRQLKSRRSFLLKLAELNYNEYKFLIENINFKIADKIIQGYKHDLGEGLGSFEVEYLKSNVLTKNGKPKMAIAWKESKAQRQEILNRGGTPFNKETAPNGEKWFVYHEAPNARLKWRRPYKTQDLYILAYAMVLESGSIVNSIKRKFFHFLNANPFGYLNYR